MYFMKNNMKSYKNVAPLGLYTKYIRVYKNVAPLGLEYKIPSCSRLAILPFSSGGAAFL